MKQSLQAYDQNALLEKFPLDRKLSPHWTCSFGVSGEQETITQEVRAAHYDLLGLPLTLKLRQHQQPARSDARASAQSLGATPTEALGGQQFGVPDPAGGRLDLSRPERRRAQRAGAARAGGRGAGAGTFWLPPDQRFYAGGSATVRGFRYQSVGPQFPDSNPTGGTAVSAATVEFRQRILGNYGAVAFVDAGQVSANGVPFSNTGGSGPAWASATTPRSGRSGWTSRCR